MMEARGPGRSPSPTTTPASSSPCRCGRGRRCGCASTASSWPPPPSPTPRAHRNLVHDRQRRRQGDALPARPVRRRVPRPADARAAAAARARQRVPARPRPRGDAARAAGRPGYRDVGVTGTCTWSTRASRACPGGRRTTTGRSGCGSSGPAASPSSRSSAIRPASASPETREPARSPGERRRGERRAIGSRSSAVSRQRSKTTVTSVKPSGRSRPCRVVRVLASARFTRSPFARAACARCWVATV